MEQTEEPVVGLALLLPPVLDGDDARPVDVGAAQDGQLEAEAQGEVVYLRSWDAKKNILVKALSQRMFFCELMGFGRIALSQITIFKICPHHCAFLQLLQEGHKGILQF